MQSVITGKAYVLGDNIDTDQIIPAQYLTYNPSIPAEYKMFGKFALSGVPADAAGLPKGHVPFHGPGDEFLSATYVLSDDTLDYFALRDDKSWLFSGNTLIAYSVINRVMLVSPAIWRFPTRMQSLDQFARGKLMIKPVDSPIL